MGVNPHTGLLITDKEKWQFQYEAHTKTVFDVLGTVEVKIFTQKEYSFAYCITGIFDPKQKTIDVGIIISLKDEDISDFWYLENKFVEIDVDRINLVVLEDVSTKD